MQQDFAVLIFGENYQLLMGDRIMAVRDGGFP